LSIKNATRFSVTEQLISDTLTVKVTFAGLNYLFMDKSGTKVGAGRLDVVITFEVDSSGNLVETSYVESVTPNLTHLSSVICPALAS
jgi:hypothetical protein